MVLEEVEEDELCAEVARLEALREELLRTRQQSVVRRCLSILFRSSSKCLNVTFDSACLLDNVAENHISVLFTSSKHSDLL